MISFSIANVRIGFIYQYLKQFSTELPTQDATYGAGSRPATPASRPGSARAAKPSARAAEKKPTAAAQKSKSGNAGLKKSASDVRFTWFLLYG